jgi:hypothetical protein
MSTGAAPPRSAEVRERLYTYITGPTGAGERNARARCILQRSGPPVARKYVWAGAKVATAQCCTVLGWGHLDIHQDERLHAGPQKRRNRQMPCAGSVLEAQVSSSTMQSRQPLCKARTLLGAATSQWRTVAVQDATALTVPVLGSSELVPSTLSGVRASRTAWHSSAHCLCEACGPMLQAMVYGACQRCAAGTQFSSLRRTVRPSACIDGAWLHTRSLCVPSHAHQHNLSLPALECSCIKPLPAPEASARSHAVTKPCRCLTNFRY